MDGGAATTVVLLLLLLLYLKMVLDRAPWCHGLESRESRVRVKTESQLRVGAGRRKRLPRNTFFEDWDWADLLRILRVFEDFTFDLNEVNNMKPRQREKARIRFRA